MRFAGLEAGRPLTELCRERGISVRTVYLWREKDEEFASRFGRARDIGYDVIAADCLDIADNSTNDWVERQRDNGSTYVALNDEAIQRSRVRIDTRLKLLAKWDPRRYGDKLDVEHSGNITLVINKPDHAD